MFNCLKINTCTYTRAPHNPNVEALSTKAKGALAFATPLSQLSFHVSESTPSENSETRSKTPASA